MKAKKTLKNTAEKRTVISTSDGGSLSAPTHSTILRHGLKKKPEFLGLYSYLKTLFPWRSSTFADTIKRNRKLRLSGMLATFGLILLVSATIAPLYIDRNYSEALTGAPTLSETTLTLSTSDINLAIDSISEKGSFNTSNNSNNVSVVTNNYTGYTLSISPESNETTARQLTITGNTTNVFNSISSATTAETYAATNSTGLNNTWGILPSKLDGVANTSYQPAPELNNPLVIEETSVANTTANNYSINMGARADYTNPVGTYTGTFIITATANEPRYDITYNANTTDAVTNLPSSQSSEAWSSTEIILSSNTPSRTGYTFNGWNTAADGTGTDYAAGATYYLDQTTANSQTLYAKWTAKQYDLVITGDSNLSSLTIKQGNTSGTTITGTKSGNTITFTNLSYGTSYYLYPVFNSGYEFSSWSKTDSATNAALGSTSAVNTYYTMGDGDGALTLASKSSIKYMQNMVLADCTTSNQTVADSRDNKTYTVKKIGNYCVMTQNLRYTGGSNGTVTAGSAVAADGTTFTMTSSTSYSQSPYYYDSGRTDYGVYYNYCAASGTQVCTGSYTALATNSICPAGWKLPTSPSSDSWGGMSTTDIKNSGDFAVYAGRYDGGSPARVGSYGFWWSATARTSDPGYRYSLYLNTSGDISAQGFSFRDLLHSVRCMLAS